MSDGQKDVYGNMYEQHVDSKKQQEELYQQTVKQLKTEQRFIDYFSNYHPDSVERFIRHYAMLKARWFAMADDYKRWKKYKEDRWIKLAFTALEQIQQKKLFNLQCLWRADKVKAEGIEVTPDFNYWQYNILFCPAIEPISQHDVDFYIRYVQESDLSLPFDEWWDMQDYERIAENYNGKGDQWYYNPWYRFYDGQYGTYLQLPDERGRKEDFYLTLRRNEYVRTHQQEIKERDERYTEELPYLNAHEGNFKEDFIKQNETAEYQKLYKIYKQRHDKFEELEKVVYATEVLEEIPLPYYPSEAADEWQEGVKKTFERFRREMTIDILPQAYQEYLQNYKNKEWKYAGRNEYGDSEEPWRSISNMRKKHIIEGRVLHGEPADLNF